MIDEEVSRSAIAITVRASKLTARGLAYVLGAVGRKIAKEHRKAQAPQGKQSARRLMRHGGDTSGMELPGDTRLFDRVARRWGASPSGNSSNAPRPWCAVNPSARGNVKRRWRLRTDSIRKYVMPNLPYLFILWACLKVGTAYRLAAGAGFGEKLLGTLQTIGPAFADFAPGLYPQDWLVGIVGAALFRLLIYCKTKKAKKYRPDVEYGSAPERMPILQDLYEELLRQPEPEARRVASALELYCTGSLNLFNHRTNVEVNSRLLCYDIKSLGKMLKKIGLLILTDQIWGRVTANRDRHKSTWVYQDEFHVLLSDPQVGAYCVEIFRRFRKWGAIPSGITQNVKSLLESSEIESIFGNCDFLYMLSQAAGDREVLASHLGISPISSPM